jgi:N utilization substance protein B
MPEFEPGDVVGSEIIEHEKSTNEATLARQVALQVLYEVDSSQHQSGDVIVGQLEYHELSVRSREYLNLLVTGILENKDRLDRVIQQFAPEFPLDQVAIIDRNILRMAVYEIGVYAQTPVRVAIDEAVQLAKVFGAEGAPRFVNGVLGAVVRNEISLIEMLKENEP